MLKDLAYYQSNIIHLNYVLTTFNNLSIIFRLSPYSFDVSPSGMECTNITHDSVPIGAIPILAGCSHDYKDIVSNVIRMANQVYREFIKSDEGFGFNGRVYFIGL